MKSREGVDKLKVEGTVCEDALQQAEVMNKNFHTVCTRESEFRMNNIITMEYLRENIKVHVKEVKQLMENQDVRKAPGPDGVSSWILKELFIYFIFIFYLFTRGAGRLHGALRWLTSAC